LQIAKNNILVIVINSSIGYQFRTPNFYNFCFFFEQHQHVCTYLSSLNAAEEYIGLDDNKYIGDLLAEFKSVKDRNKGEVMHCKLIFKKRLFRESDEAVTDPMFVQLSYVQVLFLFIFSFKC
jgi:hypothetical protein